MSAELEIKKQILIDAMKMYGGELGGEILDESCSPERYHEIAQRFDWVYEAENEFRYTGIDTDLPCPCSRHYESKQVARKLDSGKWVSWTFWYGGGKHGCPEEIDWMSDAFFVDCREEEKVVIVRTFSKSGEGA